MLTHGRHAKYADQIAPITLEPLNKTETKIDALNMWLIAEYSDTHKYAVARTAITCNETFTTYVDTTEWSVSEHAFRTRHNQRIASSYHRKMTYISWLFRRALKPFHHITNLIININMQTEEDQPMQF